MERDFVLYDKKHTINVLIYVARHPNCIQSDIQHDVTRNGDTVRETCLELIAAGLICEMLVRSEGAKSRLLTHYFPTEKGVRVAEVLECAKKVADGQPASDDEELNAKLEERFNARVEDMKKTMESARQRAEERELERRIRMERPA